MMKSSSAFTVILCLFFSGILILHGSVSNLHAQVPIDEIASPSDYLGYETGDRLTPHHRVVSYLEYIAANSDRVTLFYYGETYGERSLLTAVVTSPDNHANLEEIRTNHLKRAGLMEGESTGLDPKAIVWLSYNVHGNEISGTEAALLTLYELVTDARPDAEEWLENTVVIMDPLLNPDGRERYVNWYHQTAGRNPDPYPTSREHIEPWPNARTNHYQFDLNRDWAWQTQIETKSRMKLYHSWMPHIHADFHEMGIDSPYYFAPAAEPFHEAVSDWQREFQGKIGRNHADYFDRNYRVYYTRERFDLFYPSYGDTYPTFNGAIGMTYEQAGNTRGGLSVITAEGDTLTFERRILNQHVVGMSTVEIASRHASEMATEFNRYFERSANRPYSRYRTYVIPGNQQRDKLDLLTRYLDKWEIRYGRAGSGRNVSGFNYKTGESERFRISEDDLVISAYQPKSVLLNVLFEPQTTIIDSLTYDITAWSVPYAVGLEAYALTDRVNPAGTWQPMEKPLFRGDETAESPYAYIAKWESLKDVKFLSALLQGNIRVRAAKRPFKIDGYEYGRGTLVITRRGNERLGDKLDEIVRNHAKKFDRMIHAVTTGMVDTGIDLGSDDMQMVQRPRIALLAGPGVHPNNFGEIWHFLDRQIEYPVSIFNQSDLGSINLNDFNVLIMPAGSYGTYFSGQTATRIRDWVREGGNLIMIGSAVNAVRNAEGFTAPEPVADEEAEEREPNLTRYDDRSREAVTRMISGSIYKLKLDNTHPLGFGYPEHYFTLKSGTQAYKYLNNGWNVGRLESGGHLAGFQGYRVKDRIEDSMIFGVQPMQRGHAVYLVDNPLFRAFWHNGKLLFANAVFMVGN